MMSWQEVLLRLLAALLFCGAVGVQRYFAGKAAGVRTHILVGLGAAIFTLVSGYAFHTTASNADRIAAQIVSGIGFIGGGAILKEGGAIKGLTTAAGLWAVASLGMAAGAGLYTIGALGMAVMLLTLALLRHVEYYIPRRIAELWSIEVTLGEGGTVDGIRQVLDQQCRSITLDGLTYDQDTRLSFSADMLHGFDIDALTGQIRDAGASRDLARPRGRQYRAWGLI